ncbi:hypothetical protein [Mycobacterium sp. SA01]|uniref:hypothetical protein n=1 Tax=Mycobacterium sp. SA01 TaxID=3238820 RepID=UPI00351AB74C
MTDLKLFDPYIDHYGGPASETESAYHFLNRACDPIWQRTRELTEAWYLEYPDADGDLRARFQSDDVGQHLAAWWELYVYSAFRALGYEVEVHPTVPETDKRPDFRVSRDSSGMYVECAAMAGDDVVENAAGQAWIRESINKAKNPDFMVQVEFTEIGPIIRQLARS